MLVLVRATVLLLLHQISGSIKKLFCWQGLGDFDFFFVKWSSGVQQRTREMYTLNKVTLICNVISAKGPSNASTNKSI